MTFFPDTLPYPEIKGPFKTDDCDATRFFLYTWPKLDKLDTLALSEFLQPYKGMLIRDWAHPEESKTWGVVLSDERIPATHDASSVNPSFTVELLAFIIYDGTQSAQVNRQ